MRNTLIFLVVTLAATCVAASEKWELQRNSAAKNGPTKSSQTTDQSDNQTYPTEQSPRPVRVIEASEDALRVKEREAKSDTHEAADLEAQIRSATAAEGQVWISFIAALFSLVGTIFLVLTLRETRRIASRQLRAYIGMSLTVQLAPIADGKKAIPSLLIKNFGQTPAKKLRYTSFSRIVSAHSSSTLPFSLQELQTEVSSHALMPSDSITVQSDIDISEAQLAAIERGDSLLKVWGAAYYDDVFGETQHTLFEVRSSGSLGTKLIFTEKGNEAT